MEETGMVDILRDTIVALVRRDAPDLTLRQFGVLLVCYVSDERQTVRGLAEKLRVPKPSITRALDRLTELGLARRRPDPLDQRSIFAQLTASGLRYARSLSAIMNESTRETRSPSDNRSAVGARPMSGAAV